MELITLALISGIILVGIIALIPVFLVVVKVYPYAYTNARIRAMRARLLTKEDFDDLIEKPYNEIVYSLDKKYFPKLSTYLGSDFSYSSVDKALRSSIIADLMKIHKISPQQSKKLVLAFLSQYDIEDIQSLIRSLNTKSIGQTRSKVKGSNSINGSSSDRNVNYTREIVNVTKVFSQEFVDRGDFSLESIHNELKGTKYFAILEKHLSELRQGNFLEFETDLNLLFHSNLLSSAKTLDAKRYVKKLIDIKNISLVLKGLDPIIPNGRIPLESFSGVSSLDSVLALMSKYGYNFKSRTQEGIEREFFKELSDFAKGLLAKEPLSEATIIGFVILDKWIHRNANILLKLKSHGFSKEKINEIMTL